MRYNNIDSKDLYHNGVYPKLPLYIDQNIANYHKYFDDNFYSKLLVILYYLVLIYFFMLTIF